MAVNYLERATILLNDIHKCDEMVRGVMDKAYIDNMGRYASLEQIRQQGLQAGKNNWKTRAKFWIDICQNHTDMGKDHVNMRTENKGVFVQSMQHFECDAFLARAIKRERCITQRLRAMHTRSGNSRPQTSVVVSSNSPKGLASHWTLCARHHRNLVFL